MSKEELNESVMCIVAHSQCIVHLVDSLDFKGMNPKIASIFKDSKDIYKVVEKHNTKKLGLIYEELYKVDPNTIETIIEAYQYEIAKLKDLKIKDLLTIN